MEPLMSEFFFIISGFWLIVVDEPLKSFADSRDLKPPLTGDFKSLDVGCQRMEIRGAIIMDKE